MFSLMPYRKNSNISTNHKAWGPWTDIDRAFDTLFNGWNLTPFGNRDIMKIDIKETENAYTVDAEIPGFDKNDIKIELNDNMLTIEARKDEQEKEENDNYIRKEIRKSYAGRSFYVENIKEEDIKAKYENGILQVILPKMEKESDKKKNIDIE
ncbi:MAG: Hsp20/alpha crystallin family protein [Clostridiales bacterium]|nr:Hsp20/alpha crystallin family protein [Clostridiales bacterium]